MSTDSELVMETAALVAPVTALEFLREDFLLTGEGPVLSAFSLRPPPSAHASLSVLRNHRIHGIRPRPPTSTGKSSTPEQEEEELVVFGGKAVRLVQLCGEPLCLRAPGPLLELQDWALDVRWMSSEGRMLLGVALAHNAVLLLDTADGEVLVLRSCLEGCLLYSALLLGDTWGGSVLVGGTIFNQLVLWRPGGAQPGGEARVERRLPGHSGVIFSLCYLREAGWLASASDDRSVRVWGVGRLGGAGGAAGGCGEAEPACLRVLYGHQARVFAVRLCPGRVFSAGEDGACLVWDWGGGGRVARTLKGHRAGGVRALAVSEGGGGGRGRWVATGGADGGVRLWRVGGEEEEGGGEGGPGEGLRDLGFEGRGTPKVVCVVGGVGGRVVVGTDLGGVYLLEGGQWGLAWEGGPEFRSYCVMAVLGIRTGGSTRREGLVAVGSLTGGVRVFPLSRPGTGLRLRAGTGKVHSLLWVAGEGRGRGYLLASGAGGRVYRWRVEAGEGSDGGAVLRAEPLPPFLLPACAKRWLTAAVFLPRPAGGGLWVCGDRRGSLLLFRDAGARRPDEEKEEEEEREGEPSDVGTDERDVVVVNGTADGHNRGGGGERDDTAGEGEEEEGTGGGAALRPVCCLFGAHGKQGVTAVVERGGLLYSAGRDGCVRVLRAPGPGGGALEVLRVQRACRGMDWLETVLFLEEEPTAPRKRGEEEEEVLEAECYDQTSPRQHRLEQEEEEEKEEGQQEENHRVQEEEERGSGVREARFAMAGFHSVHFVVWDPVRRESLLSVPCGGGHRSWSLWPRPPQRGAAWPGRGAFLVFLRQGRVLSSRPPTERPDGQRPGSRGLREGLHGRGLGCVRRLGALEGAGRRRWEVLVSGGEDTSLTVMAVQPRTGEVSVLAVVTDHISSVRALAAVRRVGGGRSLSALLLSAGGRAQMQCYRLLIGWDGPSQQPSCQVIQVAGHRLDEQWERRRNRHKTLKMDPETRYMSIAVVHAGTESVLLALGCSDGAVRLFRVSEVRGQIELLWESFHHQRCVLSVATCSLEDLEGSRCVLLFSAATDGRIAVWDVSPAVASLDGCCGEPLAPPTPCLTVPAHQSGANALAVWEGQGEDPGAGRQVTVASGGDDGRLTVFVLDVQYLRGEAGGGRAPPRLRVTLRSQSGVQLAHAAPVTGLGQLGPGLLVSASPDQRLCLWSLCSTGLRQRGALFSHVADAAGLEVWQEAGEGDKAGAARGVRGWAVVCGQGLQLLQVRIRDQDGERDRGLEEEGERDRGLEEDGERDRGLEEEGERDRGLDQDGERDRGLEEEDVD